jgi:hypothetical protein
MNTPPANSSPEELNTTIEGAAVKEAAAAPITPVNRRNQFVKTDDPKSEQFTGRATVKEAERIKAAIKARKQGDEPYDIVRLCLDAINHIEADFLQTFKTK